MPKKVKKLDRSLSGLVTFVKALDLKNTNELMQVSDFSKIVLDEWRKVRAQYGAKFEKKSNFNESLHAMYEADQEIILAC